MLFDPFQPPALAMSPAGSDFLADAFPPALVKVVSWRPGLVFAILGLTLNRHLPYQRICLTPQQGEVVVKHAVEYRDYPFDAFADLSKMFARGSAGAYAVTGLDLSSKMFARAADAARAAKVKASWIHADL